MVFVKIVFYFLSKILPTALKYTSIPKLYHTKTALNTCADSNGVSIAQPSL